MASNRGGDDQIFATLWSSLVLFGVLLLVFDRLRTPLWWIYAPKAHHPSYRTPEVAGPGLLAFVWAVAKVWSGPELLEYGGVDAYVLVMFLDYAVDQCMAAAALGCVVLLPTYYTSSWLVRRPTSSMSSREPQPDRYSFSLTTALNLECRLRKDDQGDGTSRMPLYPKCANHSEWKFFVMVVVAWLLTLRALSRLSIKCCEFVVLRRAFLRTRLDSTAGDARAALTVLVERIPPSLQSMAALKTYFEVLCGEGSVQSVRIMVADLASLAALCDARERAVEASIEARSRRVRTVRRKFIEPYRGRCRRPLLLAGSARRRAARGDRESLARLRSEAVAAAEAATLADLELLLRERGRLACVERSYCFSKPRRTVFADSVARVLEIAAPRARASRRASALGRALDGCLSAMGCARHTGVEAIPHYENLADELAEAITREHVARAAASLEEAAATPRPPLDEGGLEAVLLSAHASDSSSEEPGFVWHGIFWALRVEGAPLESAYDFRAESADAGVSRAELEIEEAPSPLGGKRRSLERPLIVVLATEPALVALRTLGRRLARFAVRVVLVSVPRGILHIGRAARAVVVDYVLCGHSARTTRASRHGFRASSTAFVTFSRPTARLLALNTTLSGQPFGIFAAPAPEDRDVVWANVHEAHGAIGRRKRFVGAALVLLLLFWTVVVATTSNAKIFVPATATSTVRVWLDSILPVVALLSLINLLPLIFQALARYYERRKAISKIDFAVVDRFFRFQMVNVYVSIFASALLAQLKKAWRNPWYFVVTVGRGTPAASLFLAKLLTLTAGTSPLWCLRAWPLVSRGWNYWTLRPPELPALLYGWLLPKLILNFTIVTTSWIFSPLTSLIGLVYFCLLSVFLRYLVLYCHMPFYESGGLFFARVVERVLFSLAASNTILCFWFLSKSLVGMALLVAPLPVVVFAFANFARDAYFDPTRTASLDTARAYEQQTPRPATFDATTYTQPSLRKRPPLKGTSPARPEPGDLRDLVANLYHHNDHSQSEQEPALDTPDSTASPANKAIARADRHQAVCDALGRAYRGEVDFFPNPTHHVPTWGRSASLPPATSSHAAVRCTRSPSAHVPYF